MNKRKGFTLVELLAVIVILAIIMIIAIPSVLGTVETSRRKTFLEFFTKVYTSVQSQWLEDSTMKDGFYKGSGLYIYSIKNDLGYPATGSYDGYVLVYSEIKSKPSYFIYLFDDNFFMGVSTEGEGVPLNYDDKVQAGRVFHFFNTPGESFIKDRDQAESLVSPTFSLSNFGHKELACFISHFWLIGSSQNGRKENLYFADGSPTIEVSLKHFDSDESRFMSLNSCLAA